MLFNITKKKVIMQRVRVAAGFWQMLRGHMFRSQKSVDYALVFELPVEGTYTAAVHMLFVFFPLDIIFLDSQKKVVDVHENVRPFTPSIIPKFPARYFVEVPVGNAREISEGDYLSWD